MTEPSRWDGIEVGTLVKVRGRKGTYKFKGVFRSDKELSVTLYGPVRADGLPHEGYQSFVSVRPVLVSRLPKKQQRRKVTA